MSLQNLAQIGQLHPHDARAEEISRLLTAAERNLSDAGRSGNSTETRFDCAYKAIMQSALMALLAAGYRPATSSPGHHQTMIQTLPLTLRISNATWIKLDGFRKKRNQSDYSGVAVSKEETDEAIAEAKELLRTVKAHIRSSNPQLLRDSRE
jgi:uncharacterized protein (UPF0332 family)